MDDVTRTELTSKLAELTSSIAAWQSVVQHVEQTKQDAADGTLTPVKDLVADELAAAAMDFDFQSQEGAKDEIDSSNVISVTGGGHLYSHEQVMSDSLERHSGVLMESVLTLRQRQELQLALRLVVLVCHKKPLRQ